MPILPHETHLTKQEAKQVAERLLAEDQYWLDEMEEGDDKEEAIRRLAEAEKPSP